MSITTIIPCYMKLLQRDSVYHLQAVIPDASYFGSSRCYSTGSSIEMAKMFSGIIREVFNIETKFLIGIESFHAKITEEDAIMIKLKQCSLNHLIVEIEAFLKDCTKTCIK